MSMGVLRGGIPRYCWPGSRTKAVSATNTGNPPVPEPTNDTGAPIEIAIMVCPQAGASTIYGMYDMLAGAGRDWEAVIEGRPTEGRLRPRILSRDGVPMVVANGVTVTPDGRFEDCLAPDVVIVPELSVGNDASLVQDLSPEVAWLRRWHGAGATIARSEEHTSELPPLMRIPYAGFCLKKK